VQNSLTNPVSTLPFLEPMKVNSTEIRVSGETLHVPSVVINGWTVLQMGKRVRVAVIADEQWLEGESVEDATAFISQLKASGLKTDVVTFAQKLPHTERKFDLPVEWDSFAAIPISTYSHWFEKQVPKEIRQNVKKAARMGVMAKEVPFDDDLVRGVVAIYNETPIRQGKKFWHYGKGFDEIKKELSTYLERTRFICAYCGDQMVGFIKLVRIGQVADMMHILCRTDQAAKKPINALVAKAVEISQQMGLTHLLYGRYAYGKKRTSSLTDFKARNGFVEILVPRYYVPLTLKGRLFLKLRLHHGVRELLPQKLVDLLLDLRAKVYNRAGSTGSSASKAEPKPAQKED